MGYKQRAISTRWSIILIILIAVLLPFQNVIPTPIGRVNFSIADFFILFCVFLFATNHVFKPVLSTGYMLIFFSLVFATIGSTSLIFFLTEMGVQNYQYANISTSIVEIIKLVFSIVWGLAIYILLRRDPISMTWKMSISSVLVAFVIALWSITTTVVFGTRRAAGPLGNPNLYVHYLLFNFFLLLMISYRGREKIQVSLGVATAGVATFTTAIIFTGSRAGLGALIVGLGFLFYWLIKDSQLRGVYASVGIILSVILSILLLVTEPLIISRTIAALQGEHIGQRPTLWKNLLKGFLENPIMGIGFGQTANYVTDPTLPGSPHNTHLRYLVEVGVVGGLSISLLIIYSIRSGLGLIQSNSDLIFVVAALFSTYAYGVFHSIDNLRTYWIIIGIIFANLEFYQRQRRNHSQTDN